MKNTHPKSALSKWLEERFSMKKSTGRVLTVGLAAGAIFLALFASIAEDVILKEPLVQFDQTVLQSIPAIRTPTLNIFFSFITFLGNWQSVVFTSVVTIILLARKKQIFTSIIFFLTLIIAEGSVILLKLGVGRARPDLLLQLVSEDNFSFPSGHTLAVTIVFGFLTYLIIKNLKNTLSKILSFFAGFTSVILVGMSRIYLGVHYPSDVLASMALGSFLLSIFITVSEINERYFIFQKEKKASLKELLAVPVLLVLFSALFYSTFIILKSA